MKKTLKKALSILLSFVIIIGLIPFVNAKAATYTYNPDAAVAYAKAHYNDGKGLCAEFVSDCLKAGGFTAVYNTQAKALGRQLQEYGIKISCSGWSSSSCLKASMFSSELSKGDIIIWENVSGSSSTGHAMLYSGKTNSSGQILIYAHNKAKNEEVIVPSSSASTVYAIHLSSTYDNNYSYSFNFNANGGTLGSTGAFTTKYGQEFEILNTTCTRSGYTWAGWNVKRNNDNTWYVAGQGWCTESQISSNGYVKKTYSNYQTCKLDNSWINGLSGNGSYTFYAKWVQQRSTAIDVFLSPYGSEVDHLTAYNARTNSGLTQERIYAWYIIFDTNTGELMNTYWDKTYSVDIAIYDPNGELVYNSNYTNSSDANWIYIVPQMSGTYTATATISGEITGSTSATYEVSYDAELLASLNNVSLNLNGTNSKEIVFTPAGAYPGLKGYHANLDSSIASLTEHYWSGEQFYFTIQGNKVGSTTLYVELYENYSGNNNVVATINIPVTVTANTYTISYNANGGGGAPSSQTKYYGTDITLSSTSPTRPGYTFLGWSTSSSATSATYKAGDSFTSNANTTLYAVWKPNTYTVTFNANGGSNAPSSQTKTHDVTLTLTSSTPTRTGYTFLGWSTSSSATSATYKAGGSFTSNANTTLYAVWKIAPTSISVNSSYTATISTGGEMKYYTYTPSTSGKYVIYSTGSADTRVYLYDANLSQIDSNDDGGESQNFRLEMELTAGTKYIFGVRYYSSSTTGTIPFKFGKVYTITYNANGGSSSPSSQSKDYGADLTLSSTKPSKSGYTFLGWSTSSSATSATYQPGDTFTSNANTTLYAVWKANPTSISVNSSYNATISTGGEMKYYTYTPSTSGKYVIYSTGSADTRVYLYDANLSQIDSNDDGGESQNFRLEMELTAGTKYIFGVRYYSSSTTGTIPFKFGKVYTITYNANGGSSSPSSQSKDYGADLTLSSIKPSKSGYTFLGWSTSSSATSATYQAGGAFTSNANTTLYAVWKKDATNILLGDVTGDGVIDSTDYLRVKGHFLGTYTLAGDTFTAGDVTQDGVIDSTDYLRIKGHFLGTYNLYK